jgi:hypothetical protein
MRRRSNAPRIPIAIVSVLAMAAAAQAETLSYGVDVGVAESDNVTLVATDKISQTMAIADADIDYKEQSRRLDVDAKGNFSYLDYLQGAYGNQFIGRFDGSAHLALIPEKLAWVLQDDFGQSALDPFTPTTPTNLEDVNYLSTGPDLTLRFGPSSFLNASARYARTEYQTSPFNSNRLLGNLAWGLQLSSRSSVSLNGDTERVLFENTTLNSDFDRTNGFVRYELQGSRTDLSADLGATTISQDRASTGSDTTVMSGTAGSLGTATPVVSDPGGSTTGGLAKIQLSRKLSMAAKLTFSAGHVLTDASTSFSGLQSGAIGVVGAAAAAVTANSYTSNYASAEWQYQRNRTKIAVSGRWERDTYDGVAALDNTRGGAEFSVERKLTHAITAQLLGRLYKTDYFHVTATPSNASSNYEDGLVGLSLSWRHGRGLEVRLRAEHNSRVASGIDTGYRENRVLLTVGYRPTRSQVESDPGA